MIKIYTIFALLGALMGFIAINEPAPAVAHFHLESYNDVSK